jgi:hypothetical protein
VLEIACRFKSCSRHRKALYMVEPEGSATAIDVTAERIRSNLLKNADRRGDLETWTPEQRAHAVANRMVPRLAWIRDLDRPDWVDAAMEVLPEYCKEYDIKGIDTLKESFYTLAVKLRQDLPQRQWNSYFRYLVKQIWPDRKIEDH